MSSKHIPWAEPVLGEAEEKLILEVLGSNYLNDGNLTRDFETQVTKLLGIKHAVAVTSGTAAMFMSLKALDVEPGDEVIVPDITFIATANAVSLTGAQVVLVDINPEDLNINVKEIEKAITKKTKAIIPVHVTGRAADMAAITELANKHDLAVVEDAAEAIMSKYQGKYLGTWGQTGCFSFTPFKIITSGQGGMIVTDDDEIHQRLRELKDQGRSQQGTGGDDVHESIGYNFKYTNLQAAVALGQLELLTKRIARRKKVYQMYLDNLKPDTVNLFKFDIEAGELPLWIDGWTDKRDELVKYLQSKNIETRNFWQPLHAQKPYQDEAGKFPHSTTMSAQSFWLPSAHSLSDKDIMRICDEINSFFHQY